MTKTMLSWFALLLIATAVRAADMKEVNAAFKDEDYPRAISILNDYVKQHPNDLSACALRGRALVEMGDWQKAIPDLDKAIAGDAGRGGMPIFNRGRAYLGLGEYDKAIADFDKSISINPKPGVRYYYRGKAYLAKDDRDKARADFDKAIERDAKDARAILARGMMRFDESCTFSVYVREQNGQTVQYRRPTSVRNEQWMKSAIEDLTKAIELDGKQADGLRYRSQAFKLTGDQVRWIADQKSLCTLEPFDAESWNELAWELATNPADSVRNGAEAVSAAEKACNLTNRKNPAFLDSLAAACAEAGDFAKAGSVQREAIKLVPKAHQEPFNTRLQLYERKQPYRSPPPVPAAQVR